MALKFWIRWASLGSGSFSQRRRDLWGRSLVPLHAERNRCAHRENVWTALRIVGNVVTSRRADDVRCFSGPQSFRGTWEHVDLQPEWKPVCLNGQTGTFLFYMLVLTLTRFLTSENNCPHLFSLMFSSIPSKICDLDTQNPLSLSSSIGFQLQNNLFSHESLHSAEQQRKPQIHSIFWMWTFQKTSKLPQNELKGPNLDLPNTVLKTPNPLKEKNENEGPNTSVSEFCVCQSRNQQVDLRHTELWFKQHLMLLYISESRLPLIPLCTFIIAHED